MRLEEMAIAYQMDGQGVPLVFLHEVATDQRLWRRQRAYFHRRYRVITVDMLGHGAVAWPEMECSIGQAGRRVGQLLERLGTGPAFVIGVSMGAAVAMRVALEAPELVLGLVLVSPWSHANEHVHSLVDRLFRLAEAADMTTYMQVFLRYGFPAADLERFGPEIDWLRAVALEQDARAVAYAWAACLAVELGGELRGIGAPSLVIAGFNDFLTPPYLARAVAAELPVVELEVWEETGHFPFLEDPLRFNRRLEAFILHCLSRADRQ